MRVRTVGGRQLQTIKANGGGALERAEWEEEIGRARPRLELAENTALAPLLTSEVTQQLKPVFETNVDRAAMPLHFGDSEIELAFDDGQVASADASIQICEIEIELKRGERSDVARLARKIARSVPVSFGARAKAGWGYALIEGSAEAPIAAEPVAVARSASAADSFAVIGFACLRQIAGNELAVRRGDGEGIHQMRVGLRRFRAALSLFKEILPGREVERLKRELKWLTEQLGPARDSDVFLAKTVGPHHARHPERIEFEALTHDLEKERRSGLAGARAAVDSDRFRRLLLNCALWLLDGDWRSDADPLHRAMHQHAARAFARDELARRERKIVKRVKKLEKLDARRRHKLRIAVKKLRYGREFFASLTPDRGSTQHKLNRALKGLQGALGSLNDMRVHAAWARDLARANVASRKAFAAGYLTGREDARATRMLRKAVDAGKRLRKVA